MKKRTSKQKHGVYYFIAFLLPLSIVAVILALRGIWWGSETTILASDGFHQYAIFNQTLRNALHGQGSIFYTFTSGLGLNFYALSSYYLGSFLSPIVFFFDVDSMPDAMYLITLIKFGLIGLTTYFSLHSIHKRLNQLLLLALSTSLALMSFATSQLEINIWLDVFIFVPLVLLGLHRLSSGQGRVLYFVSLSLLFIQNYYFGYMTAIFLAFWFFLEISWDFKKRIKYFIDFTVVSTLSGVTSLIMLLPTYLDLKTHGEALTKITSLQTENSWWLDLFAKNIVGSYDTTKFGAIPMIFVGLFPLILTLLFFTVKSVKVPVKITYAAFLAFLTASFYLQPLDLFWQGMHAPNMFLHRYAWVFSVTIIYMAAHTLSRFKQVTLTPTLVTCFCLFFGFGLTFYFKSHYSFLENIHFLLTLEFLLVYLILLVLAIKRRISSTLFVAISLFFVLFEMSIHTHYQVDGLAEEWNFPSRSNYQTGMSEIRELVTSSQKNSATFFRMERLLPQTGNDSMKYNYNGISQFSSIRNRSSSSTLDKLGFRSDDTNLNLRYQNNTLIADSLFAVKYNLSEANPQKFGFSHLKTKNHWHLFKNQYAASLGILTQEIYKDVKFTNLTLDNQTRFLNQLTGLDLEYYANTQPVSSQNALMSDKRVFTKNVEKGESAHVSYTFDIPYDSQLYISLPNIRFTNNDQKNVRLIVNDLSRDFTLDNTFSFFDAGYFTKGEKAEVLVSFPENTQVSFDKPQFYLLNLKNYQTAMEKLLNQKISVKTKGNTVLADYQAENDASILFTIPYDKGWSASIDGHPVSLKRAQGGFMKLDVKKGSGQVTLTFIPNGFVIGVACFCLGILTFAIYDYLRRKTLS